MNTSSLKTDILLSHPLAKKPALYDLDFNLLKIQTLLLQHFKLNVS